MIKLFNQSIGGLGLTKAKSFIRASFLSGRPKQIGSLVAAFVVVGASNDEPQNLIPAGMTGQTY